MKTSVRRGGRDACRSRPAAAERSERRDRGSRGVGASLRQLVLSHEQEPVRVQDVRQADDSPSIRGFRGIARSLESGHLVQELARSGLGLNERHERVLDVFGRPEDRLPKASQCFLFGAARLRDLGVDLAEVEKPPAEPGDALRLKRRRPEEVIDVDTLEAEKTGELPGGPNWNLIADVGMADSDISAGDLELDVG